ncbi:MAG: methylmalonyl-CoA mutase [Gemmatimonadetes bacterium]|nr:methylmalonyl-CoA mutase [Gemmatimonadota bacterium]MYJ69383.1 methylmalonyl-CoA mutase [Gemmatimonadota bacterium]
MTDRDDAPFACDGLPEGFDTEADLGEPGGFPFTRGVYRSMYRGRRWTMRQYAGFGTAEETNRRYHFLLERGTTGLSVAFDLPTQMGFDSDAAMAAGEVGRVGVAIDTIDDMRTLLRGIDLGAVSCSMTINATAPILLALYAAVADETGVERALLRGTIQNDILKEYIARGTYIYPVEPSLRLVSDLMAFCARELPRWNTISVSGYHIREAGSTAAQEVAFTLSNGIEYVRQALARGIALEHFAPRISFFFAAHNDLLEEVAKFRAARRVWARIMRERFGASDRSCRLRFHTQTGGSTLTAQQPMNNVVRVAIQALAGVLGGTQSLHTNGYDEALGLPTAEAAALALRTQQILAEESGVAQWADPLGGSFLVEHLTNRVEAGALALMERIEGAGGASRAIEFMRDEIHREAYLHQLEVEAGARVVVGVNRYATEEQHEPSGGTDFRRLETLQIARLAAFRSARDGKAAEWRLAALREAARGEENLLPPMIDCVKGGVTLGEISDALRAVWGTYNEPA